MAIGIPLLILIIVNVITTIITMAIFIYLMVTNGNVSGLYEIAAINIIFSVLSLLWLIVLFFFTSNPAFQSIFIAVYMLMIITWIIVTAASIFILRSILSAFLIFGLVLIIIMLLVLLGVSLYLIFFIDETDTQIVTREVRQYTNTNEFYPDEEEIKVIDNKNYLSINKDNIEPL